MCGPECGDGEGRERGGSERRERGGGERRERGGGDGVTSPCHKMSGIMLLGSFGIEVGVGVRERRGGEGSGRKEGTSGRAACKGS